MTAPRRRFKSRRLSPYLVEIPAEQISGMQVPARIFADDRLWEKISRDRTVEQIVNVATLPGVEGYAFAMPDAHEGYGFPVGGVAAFDSKEGVISPGGVGYDINCGVRLLAAPVSAEDAAAKIEPLTHELSRSIPSGPGRGGELRLAPSELERVLGEGATYLVEREMGLAEDLDAIEAGGGFAAADPAAVSSRARQRGQNQLGTIGSGNHFVEVQVVDRVFNSAAAEAMGLEEGNLTVLIHTGSRGLGHQVCTDFVRQMDTAMSRYGIKLPDRELACVPFSSAEGQRYFAAMCAAANYAFANRQAITHACRRSWETVLGNGKELRLVYDVAHNMAKLERHGGDELVVHRKGATRAFGPSHAETPERYRSFGQPVLIPGSMGTASYVLVGTDEAFASAFGSCCHGAGREMSRRAAKRKMAGAEVRKALQAQGIVVRCQRAAELAEEAPHAYKDVEAVVDVVTGAKLARRVARLRPLGVVKG